MDSASVDNVEQPDDTSLSISTTYSLSDLIPSEGVRVFDLVDFCQLRETRLEGTQSMSVYCCSRESSTGLRSRALLVELIQPGRSAWLRIERRLDLTPVPSSEWLTGPGAPLDVVRTSSIPNKGEIIDGPVRLYCHGIKTT